MPRSLFAALAFSLLLHLSILAGSGRLWPDFPRARLDFPIEASLALVAPSPMQAAQSPTQPRPPAITVPPSPRRAMAGQAVVVAQAPVPETPPAADVAPMADGDPTPGVESVPPPIFPPVAAATTAAVAEPVTSGSAEPSPSAPIDSQPPPQPPPPPLRTAVRPPPAVLAARYAVEMDNGFVAGRATYHWQSRAGHYRLESVVEAVGLASLFITGRIIQESEGEVDAHGLRPSTYRLRRGEGREHAVRFDWARHSLDLGNGELALAEQAQDLLSFPFHLALTARAEEGEFTLWVTNGKRLREYRFLNLGGETITLGEHRHETLHLQGSREGEGSLDVWLDLGRAGLPVKIRTQDQKGQVMVMRLEDVGFQAD